MKKTLIGIALLSGIFLLAGCTKGEEEYVSPYTPEQRTAFAQCLTDKGVTMYGTERCPHCKDQKKLFGEAFADVNYVDCDQQKLACDTAGIEGFPTWKDTTGNARPGAQPLETLGANVGCSL